MKAAISWNQIRLGLIVFVASFVLALFASKPADAHDIGWRWEVPTAPIVFENRTANYGGAVTHAAQQYNNQTDLTVTKCPDNGICGTLVFIQGNYGGGPNMFSGLSFNYSHSNPCTVFTWPWAATGNCNTTNKRVDFGYIYFNTAFPVSVPTRWVVKHEAGHSFGLNHVPDDCQLLSVMMTGVCANRPKNLQTHDIQDINAWY